MNLWKNLAQMDRRSRYIVIGWAVGIPLLFVLNFWRDTRRLISAFEWEPVIRKTLNLGVTSTGVMEAARLAEIKSTVDETVVTVLVHEGEAVKEGQRLMELSRTRTKLEFDQRKNSFSNADLDYKKAVQEEQIQRRLYSDKAVSRSQLEDAVRNKEKAKAAREISLQEFELAKQKLDSTTVRSPMNGVVLKIKATPGSSVSGGKDLVAVGDISRFIVRTKVDELDIKQIGKGQPVILVADAYPDEEMKGVVQAIATQAEREAFAKIEVLIDIVDSAGVPLKHNLSVRSTILTGQIPDALSVPMKAIQKKREEFAWVLVRSRFNLIHERKIVLGRPAGLEVEVRSGLKPGERVGFQSAVMTK